MGVACSQSRGQAAVAGGQSADALVASRADTTADATIDCKKVYSPADAAGLLMPPVTVEPVPGSVAWCAFGNDFSGDITVSVGSDESVEVMWNDATLSSNRVKFAPLAGVGDKAVFKAGTNPELASKKGRVYCIVAYDRGTSDHYKTFKSVGTAEVAKKLGILCTKAFAAVGA